MKKNKFTYKTLLIFLVSTLISISLSSVITDFKILSAPFYISLIYLKFSPILSTISFIIGLIYEFDLMSLYSGLTCAFIILSIFGIYKKTNKTVGGELIIYSLLSILGFLFFDNKLSLPIRLICGGVSLASVFIFIYSSRVIFIKKFDYKITSLEIVCLSVFTAVFELGFNLVFGEGALKALNIFIMLTAVFTLDSGKSMIVSMVLAIAPSVFTQSIYPFAVYSILTLSATILSKQSKILSAFLVMAMDLAFIFLTDVYGPFYYTDLIYLITPIILFLFIPPAYTNSIKEKLTAIRNKYLSKYAVNRVRATISNRLYEISDVFKEMEKSFDKLKTLVSSDEVLLSRMADEVIINVCENCPQYRKCKELNNPDRKELIKIISVALAKNRISLVDLTKRFTERCSYINGIIYEINGLITKYREKVKESEDVLSGKELIRMQSEGVAGVLKNMAFDFSKTLEYSFKYEHVIADGLKKRGIIFNEIMCYLSDDGLEINLIIKNDFIKNGRLIKAVNEITNYQNNVVLKTAIALDCSAVTIKRAPLLDAAFGIANKTKDGSSTSGDTHSLTKIDEGKFLIALSDGMGSGLRAENTSSTAISLIESFYKAGLQSKLILSMVNKVLALNTDDNFSAMDILTVNLFDLNADFIKIGAPFSFILSDDNIKIIEGSSLPLGILDDLTPTGTTTTLNEGDTVIMVTDGISDAFGSSTDLIDFLRTLENRNPQEIADSILNKALNIEKGYANDDMSVLAVRIFKKVS